MRLAHLLELALVVPFPLLPFQRLRALSTCLAFWKFLDLFEAYYLARGRRGERRVYCLILDQGGTFVPIIQIKQTHFRCLLEAVEVLQLPLMAALPLLLAKTAHSTYKVALKAAVKASPRAQGTSTASKSSIISLRIWSFLQHAGCLLHGDLTCSHTIRAAHSQQQEYLHSELRRATSGKTKISSSVVGKSLIMGQTLKPGGDKTVGEPYDSLGWLVVRLQRPGTNWPRNHR